VLKSLQTTIMRRLQGQKSSYLISAIIFATITIIFSWYIQLKSHDLISNGNTLYILIVLIAIFLIKIFKFPLQMFLLIPIFGKKIIWAFLIPCLAAAIGIKLSLSLSQINIISSGSPLFINGDTIVGVLNISFLSVLPAILFCIVIAVGTELIFRAFFIESCLRANIKAPWFFAGIFQFIAFIPFLWFGYFGGGEGNLIYLICWLLLFVFLSAFHYWLSLSSTEAHKERAVKMHEIIANRSVVLPIIAASMYQFLYYVVAARTLSENENLWMSGPANVITIVIYLIITIFLLMTKRLKY
jgi:hypothetical protein